MYTLSHTTQEASHGEPKPITIYFTNKQTQHNFCIFWSMYVLQYTSISLKMRQD